MCVYIYLRRRKLFSSLSIFWDHADADSDAVHADADDAWRKCNVLLSFFINNVFVGFSYVKICLGSKKLKIANCGEGSPGHNGWCRGSHNMGAPSEGVGRGP